MRYLPLPVILLHGSAGTWDELAILTLSAAAGVVLAVVLSGSRWNKRQ